MARKTMAERYAAQRSRKPVSRRRTLPRLSDAATVLQERALDTADDEERADGSRGQATATFTAGASARPLTPALPRRSAASGRGTILPAATINRVDFGYVKRDLRRIAITAVVMLVLLIVLNLIIQAIFVH